MVTFLFARWYLKKNGKLMPSLRLEPHESSHTDVVLLGHSLGGILAAEVALLHSQTSQSSPAYKHRILGTLSFDTPFLGMHPGVVKSGIGSILQASPLPPPSPRQQSPLGSPQSTNLFSATNIMNIAAGLFNGYPNDPNFDPRFPNDNRHAERSTWESALHFVTKHRGDLRQATKALLVSHLEFGGCLADFEGLKERYYKLRMLEEEDVDARRNVSGGVRNPPRVRFGNYYTNSTGRVRPVKKQTQSDLALGRPMGNLSLEDDIRPDDSISVRLDPPSPASRPTTTVLFDHDEQSRDGDGDSVADSTASESMTDMWDLDPLEPRPVNDDDDDASDSAESDDTIMTPPSTLARSTVSTIDVNLTPAATQLTPTSSISPSTSASNSTSTSVSSLPQPPNPPNLANMTKENSKRALKQFEADLKAYRHAIKAMRKAENERTKVEEKRVKAEAKRLRKTGCGSGSGSGGSLPVSNENITQHNLNNTSTHTNTIPGSFPTSTAPPPPTSYSNTNSNNDNDTETIVTDTSASTATTTLPNHNSTQRQPPFSSIQTFNPLIKASTERSLALRKASEERNKTVQKAILEREKGNLERVRKLEKASRERKEALVKASMERDEVLVKAGVVLRSTTSQTVMGNATGSRDEGGEEMGTVIGTPEDKPRKPRTFCSLPPLDPETDEPDPTWIKVKMAGVDEIGAHQGLFFPVLGGEEVQGEISEHEGDGDDDGDGDGDGGNAELTMALRGAPEWSKRYAFLVRDVSVRIKEWVYGASVE